MKIKRKVWVPPVLTNGKRGTLIKIWTFLLLNQPSWFTTKEITEYLKISRTSAESALKKLREYPEIHCEKERPWRGRPQNRYRYAERAYFTA